MIKNAKQIVIPEDKNTVDVSEVRNSSLIQVLHKGDTIGFVIIDNNGLYLIKIGMSRTLAGCRDLVTLIRKYPQYTFYEIGD